MCSFDFVQGLLWDYHQHWSYLQGTWLWWLGFGQSMFLAHTALLQCMGSMFASWFLIWFFESRENINVLCGFFGGVIWSKYALASIDRFPWQHVQFHIFDNFWWTGKWWWWQDKEAWTFREGAFTASGAHPIATLALCGRYVQLAGRPRLWLWPTPGGNFWGSWWE